MVRLIFASFSLKEAGSSAQGWCIFEPKGEPFRSRFEHMWLLSLLQMISCLIQDVRSATYHRHIRAVRLWVLKGHPFDRSPGQWACIHHHVTRRQIERPKGMDEIAERDGSMRGSAIWRCLGIFVGERSADLPFLDHAVVDESERTRVNACRILAPGQQWA